MRRPVTEELSIDTLLPIVTGKQWEVVDSDLAQSLVSAVLIAPPPQEKHSSLCQGIYDCMVSRFGTLKSKKQKERNRKAHERKLKSLRKKSAAKKVIRQARSLRRNDEVVHKLSVKFHWLLRLHSKAKKLSKMKLEAFKARRECQRSFWRFASGLFNKEDSIHYNTHF